MAITPPTPDCPLALIEGDGGTSPLGVDSAQVEQAFRDHGALLLRGFVFDAATFGRFAERLCATSVFNESPNRALLEDNIQSADLGIEAFPLHPELSREPWRPDACLFACLEAPAHGGETTVCDGVALAAALPRDIAERLAGRRLLYIQPATADLLEYWLGSADADDRALASPPASCPYFFRRIGGRVFRGFSRPLLHRPMFHEGPAFGNFLLFARDHLGLPNFPCLDDGKPVPAEWLDAVRSAAEPITFPVSWRRGDILVIDNSRFMHGRRAILDPRSRKIATYFGYLHNAPPNPDEPPNPIWRQQQFRPPMARRG